MTTIREDLDHLKSLTDRFVEDCEILLAEIKKIKY